MEQKNTFQLKVFNRKLCQDPNYMFSEEEWNYIFITKRVEKKSESYEVEIKTNWHAYFILMNLTEPINCTAVVFFFILLRWMLLRVVMKREWKWEHEGEAESYIYGVEWI